MGYRRYLNDNDYLSIITQDSLNQMIRGNTERLLQAEQSAEMSVVEFLSENYEIVREFNKGKYIAPYDRRITFPVGSHLYLDHGIYKVIRSISGLKKPSDLIYWEEHHPGLDSEIPALYSQFKTYYPGELVLYNEVQFVCVSENGYEFSDIRIPLCTGWQTVEFSDWMPVEYRLWDVVLHQCEFYTLISLDNYDNNQTPLESANWGAIADYREDYNDYELSPHEYVVWNGMIYTPEIDVNSDTPVIGENVVLADPRNYNLTKHMVRLAVYELTKLIAPNNVSTVRIRDYEESMKWLMDCSKLRRNPQIPRRIGDDKKEITDWQISTFQADYDPYKNPWLT